MRAFRSLALLLALCLLLSPQVLGEGLHEADDGTVLASDLGPDAAGSLLPAGAADLDAAAAILYERTSGTLVYGKGMDQRRYPASLTKLMTCLLALENGDPEAAVPVTESALADMDPDGSAADLRAGETYTLRQLLYCLMVKSANDAALVIAEYIGGSQAGFVELMNQRAAELGCTGTHFVNPHGMHHEDHYSTARDLMKIALADLEYGLFRELWSTGSYTLPETGDREERVLYSTNYLISTAITDEYYDPRVSGGKTGFTTPAGRCVVCAATEDGTENAPGCQWLLVVLGAGGVDAAGETVYGSFLAASALLDLCWGRYGPAELEPPALTLPVRFGDGDAALEAQTSVRALLPLEPDPALLDWVPVLEGPLTAPLEAGSEVGSLSLRYGNVELGQTPLYTAGPVGYVEPVYPARESRPPGRFFPPLGVPGDRLPFRV